MERGAVGGFRRPAQPLELYEFEGCPFCRKVALYNVLELYSGVLKALVKERGVPRGCSYRPKTF